MAILLPPASSSAAPGEPMVLDEFEDLSGWKSAAPEGAHVAIVHDSGRRGLAMRIDFDLNAAGGYVLVRKELSLPLPENYAFSFQLRGEAPDNNFEFKLVDSSGKNVWWRNQRDFGFPSEWQAVTIRRSRIAFAWGPSPGVPLKHAAAIEFAISSGSGGKGSVWIDDLLFEEREPVGQNGVTPVIRASSSMPGHDPAAIMDQDATTEWRSEPVPGEQWLLIDLLKNREYGGLVIDWDRADYASSYQVQVSNDGASWAVAYLTTTGSGSRDYIYMPDAESRYIRLQLDRSSREQGYGIAQVTVKPFEFSASPNQFFEAIARDAPFGAYPKYFYGTQSYWTVVGVEGDTKEALLNEEGMLEVEKGSFSIEPFLLVDGELLTWNAVRIVRELRDGYLPIPSVTWQLGGLSLKVTAFAEGKAGASTLHAIYRVDNDGESQRTVRLFLTIRPFQVSPPWQSLNMSGGVTHIREMRFDGSTVWVDGKAVVSLTTPERFGATTFEHGSITDFLSRNDLPLQSEVSDAFGFASGALQYSLTLEPKAHAEVYLAVPFHQPKLAVATGLAAEQPAETFVRDRLEETDRRWRTLLNRVEIQLPPEAEKLSRTLKSTIAYVLINRDGPALQPGSRNYARSWIRDGAMTSSALLAMGFTSEVREFLQWYAGHQLDDGKVPCCIDRRGADPTPEHDSHGQFIYAVTEYYRHTRDVGFLNDMWPSVVRAVDYIDALRRRRTTDAFRAPEKLAFFGLLPESISHEGYAAHPVHSYWDDFFALRGLKDAAAMARVVGDRERVERFTSLRDAFQHDLYASIARTMANHGIDYLPGSVELGDLDPTSTAIALVLGGENGHLPQAALTRTFETYYEHFEQRRSGAADWSAYTPYEVRNVSAFLRLGWRDRAHELLRFFLADQRPPEWNQWPEISSRDPRAPRFLGDLPHTWVGSSFVQSVLGLFAYEREGDGALVLGAGVLPEWVRSSDGVVVKRLPTRYGILNYRCFGDRSGALVVELDGDLNVPPGGIVIVSPLTEPLRTARVNDRPANELTTASVTVREFPATVVLEY
jgi:hypothetical protein